MKSEFYNNLEDKKEFYEFYEKKILPFTENLEKKRKLCFTLTLLCILFSILSLIIFCFNAEYVPYRDYSGLYRNSSYHNFTLYLPFLLFVVLPFFLLSYYGKLTQKFLFSCFGNINSSLTKEITKEEISQLNLFEKFTDLSCFNIMLKHKSLNIIVSNIALSYICNFTCELSDHKEIFRGFLIKIYGDNNTNIYNNSKFINEFIKLKNNYLYSEIKFEIKEDIIYIAIPPIKEDRFYVPISKSVKNIEIYRPIILYWVKIFNVIYTLGAIDSLSN